MRGVRCVLKSSSAFYFLFLDFILTISHIVYTIHACIHVVVDCFILKYGMKMKKDERKLYYT